MPKEAKTEDRSSREEEENQRHSASKKRERAAGGTSSGMWKRTNLQGSLRIMRGRSTGKSEGKKDKASIYMFLDLP